MAGVEVLVVFWKEWGIQALVLLSFSLQVILLITAEIRKRRDSGVLRVIVWSAYLLADTTAVYALGHMSVSTTISNSSRRLQEQQLVAFWAPFLLLHLGGQDNITAYSIEDNRLWLRHLQNFAVQVLACGYVLYQSHIVGRRPATILMFVVGVIKYGERVWALNCASTSNLSGKNYRSFGSVHVKNPSFCWGGMDGPDGLLLISHTLLNFSKHLLKGPLPIVALEIRVSGCDWGQIYQVAEVQLSLMYEVFYSKAPVIFTWYGLCIRVISPVATVISFLLFRGSSDRKNGYYSRADVAVTYVLLVGSVVLEITSLLRAMFSSWAHAGINTLILLHHERIECVGKLLLHGLIYMFIWPRLLLKWAMRKAGLPIRYWSGTMGQHNFIQLCAQSRDSRSSKMATWLGREDWWNTMFYTSSVSVPADFSQLLQKQLLRRMGVSKQNPDHINNSRGRAALKGMGVLQEDLASWSVDIPLDESILVWHIATHVYLSSWYDDAKGTRRPAAPLATAIEVISNYMLFLLAARPYMLPDNASRQSYVELCNKVMNHLHYSSAEDLVRLVREHGEALNTAHTDEGLHAGDAGDIDFVKNSTFDRASQLGAKLIGKELTDMLDLIAQVWMEMLCYASYRCRPDSHARQLSNGGEIATVVAILMEFHYAERNGLFNSGIVSTSALDWSDTSV